MSQWFWYVERKDELFIDIDKFSNCVDHLRRRLQGAYEQNKLLIKSVNLYPSASGGNHFHLVITLREFLPDIERFVWEIILRGDIYRGCCNLMRSVRGVGAPSVLITREEYSFRKPDHYCTCKTKHNAETMNSCLVAAHLRGDARAKGFFGKPSKNPCIWL